MKLVSDRNTERRAQFESLCNIKLLNSTDYVYYYFLSVRTFQETTSFK